MEIKLNLETINFHEAADALLIEMAFQIRSRAKSLMSAAAILNINRCTLARKLRQANRYAEFTSAFETLPRGKPFQPRPATPVVLKDTKAERVAAYNAAFAKLVPLPVLPILKKISTTVDAVPHLTIGVKNEITSR